MSDSGDVSERVQPAEGKLIQEHREALGWTAVYCGRLAGITGERWRHCERGWRGSQRIHMQTETLVTMASIVRVSPADPDLLRHRPDAAGALARLQASDSPRELAHLLHQIRTVFGEEVFETALDMIDAPNVQPFPPIPYPGLQAK